MTEPATATDTTAAPSSANGGPAPGSDIDDRSAIRDLPPVTERELAAQRRGLASAYIAGGEDPDPERTHREEARFVRLLILMIALIVGISLIVTFVGLIVAGPAS